MKSTTSIDCTDASAESLNETDSKALIFDSAFKHKSSGWKPLSKRLNKSFTSFAQFSIIPERLISFIKSSRDMMFLASCMFSNWYPNNEAKRASRSWLASASIFPIGCFSYGGMHRADKTTPDARDFKSSSDKFFKYPFDKLYNLIHAYALQR